MKTLKETKKITLATLKAFAKRNEGKIYAKTETEFNSMVDGVEKSPHSEWKKAELTEEKGHYKTGIQGVYTVGFSRDYFSLYEDNEYEGIEVNNCCGVTILAIKREATENVSSGNKETLPQEEPVEHPHDLIEKGKQFDKVKEQRDELRRRAKQLLSALEYEKLSKLQLQIVNLLDKSTEQLTEKRKPITTKMKPYDELTDTERYQKTDKVIAKFKDGKRMYHKSALFNRVVQTLVRDVNEYNVIESLITVTEDTQKAFEQHINRDTRPMLIPRD